MIKCDFCKKDLEFHEAIFMGDSVTCECCKPSDEPKIGGLPASIFSLFVDSYLENQGESNDEDIINAFSSHNDVIDMYLPNAYQCLATFKAYSLNSEKLNELSDIIPSAMFLSYLNKDEVREMIKEKNPDTSAEIIDVALELT